MRDARTLVVSMLAAAALLAASPAADAQDAGAPRPAATETPGTDSGAPAPVATDPGAEAAPPEKKEKKKKKKDKHKESLETGDGDEETVSAPGAPNQEAPTATAPEDDDKMMSRTGEDPFGEEQDKRLETRLLIQARYARTQVDQASLVRAGELDPMGLPYTASEASTQSFYQRITPQKQDGFTLHRVFLRETAKVGKHVKAKLLVDFSEFFYNDPEKALKLAYIEAEPFKRVKITAGLFKRTFSLLELLPIARFELSDTGPTDDFIKDLGWGGRDVGVMVQVEPLPKKRWLRLYLGSYSGDSQEGYDARPWKLLTGRAEFEPIHNHLRIGADMAWRPTQTLSYKYKDDPTGAVAILDKGVAFSGDVTINAAGVEVRAEVLYGQRTDLPFRGAADRFFSSWMIARYLFPAGDLRLMPTLRAEWLDADATHAGGGRFLGSAALNIGFSRSLWLLLDVTRNQAQRGAPALHHVPSAPDLIRGLESNWWAFVAQMQIEL